MDMTSTLRRIDELSVEDCTSSDNHQDRQHEFQIGVVLVSFMIDKPWVKKPNTIANENSSTCQLQISRLTGAPDVCTHPFSSHQQFYERCDITLQTALTPKIRLDSRPLSLCSSIFA